MTAALREVGIAVDHHPPFSDRSVASRAKVGPTRRVPAFGELVAVAAGSAASFLLGLAPLTGTASIGPQLGTAVVLLALWLFISVAVDGRHRRPLERSRPGLRSVAATALLFLAACSTAAFLTSATLSPTYAATTAAGAGVLSWAVRASDSRRARRDAPVRVLVVGSRTTASSLLKRLARLKGVEVAGVCLEPDSLLPSGVSEVPVVGTSDQAADLAGSLGVDVVAVTGAAHHSAEYLRELMWALEHLGTEVVFPVDVPDVGVDRVRLSRGALPVVGVQHASFRGGRYLLKGVLDWVGAAALTLLLTPVWLGVAAAVKLTSPGPVFYRQVRVGRDGAPFRIWKFRSMRVGADAMKDALEGDADRGNVVMFKMKDDPRVTRVGRFIRRYSIDELPQLFNVLAGQMSLIGPRPALPDEVAAYAPPAPRRLRVKPGMTGLWQVSGRSNLSWEDTVRLDVAYADNWTLAGDAQILARTAKAVVSSDGAY